MPYDDAVAVTAANPPDADDTLEYSDDPDAGFCYRSFPVWHSEHSIPQLNDWAGYAELNEDYLAHAVRDAEYISNCSSREDNGSLAWDAKQADFIIPFGARESFCFLVRRH